VVSVGCWDGGERVGRLAGGLEGYERATRGGRLGALDMRTQTLCHTTRVSRSGSLPPVDAVRVCSSGFLSGAGIRRQDYPTTRSGSSSPQLGGVGRARFHSDNGCFRSPRTS